MLKTRTANPEGLTPLETLRQGNNIHPVGRPFIFIEDVQTSIGITSDRAQKRKFLTGLTLVELMVATVIALIVVLGIGIVLVDSQRGFSAIYNRVYSGVVTDGYVARKTFDSVIRKAGGMDPDSVDAGNWVEVHYYADANSTALDCYARFYCAAGQLNIEYGSREPGQTPTTSIVCRNVQGCVFKKAGRSAQMILTLDNGSQTMTVVSSAVMQN